MRYKRKYLPQVGFVVKETSLIQKQPSTWALQLPRSCTRHDLVALGISHVTVPRGQMLWATRESTFHKLGFVVKETSLIQKQPSTWALQLPRSCTRHDLVALRIRHVTVHRDKCYAL